MPRVTTSSVVVERKKKPEGQKPLSLDFEGRKRLLMDMPNAVIRQAWFTIAHLVLEPGARVLSMDCGDGASVYAMAVMNPKVYFTGIDKSSKAIKKAREQYKLPNLQFLAGEITETFLPKKSLDAVINDFNLHNAYSAAGCNEQTVTQMLQRQFDLLKENGQMFIRDYAMPPADNFVLMEIPEEPSAGPEVEDLSEAELLIWFSQKARPREDEASRGFYLEELPQRFPKTRFFRLPQKWAYEFIMRKDSRASWMEELATEYTFYTERDYRRTLGNMGARVLYTAPHWDDQIIKNRFEKRFKLLDEDQKPLGPPPTSFIALAQKTGERRSLTLEERRPTQNTSSHLRMTAMRDEADGRILDVVIPDTETAEIIPYRVTSNNRLHVFVHEGLPRAIINAVPRGTPNLDGKKWSGHMTEAIAVDKAHLEMVNPQDVKTTIRFAQEHLGLRAILGAPLEEGPNFYPAPDHIDERIDTHYLRVEKLDAPIQTKTSKNGFSSKGRIREVDAQDILSAIFVGLIPTSRLEIQLMALYKMLGIKYETWAESPLALKEEEPENASRLQDIIDKLSDEKPRFKEARGSAGQLRIIQSVFVDEGQARGGITSLGAEEMEFITSEENTMNTAVVLPLTKKQNGEVMAGLVSEYLPVPQRYQGNGLILSCPSFPLPKDITNFDLAKRYIAEQFDLKPENVSRMGEGFFSHIGMTPQRVYPFAIASAGTKGWKKVGRTHGPCHYAPLYDLADLLYLDNYYSFIKICAMSYQQLGENSDLSVNWNFEHSQSAQKSSSVSTRNLDVVTMPSKSADIDSPHM